jgi:SAM-dependent methyltransferase
MRPALLEILRCPRDGTSLGQSGDALACSQGHTFPVREGIPRFVADDHDQSATELTFGTKWGETAPESKRSLAEFQLRWFEQRFGWGDEQGLADHLAGCRRVLDAGAGLGYDAARYARLATNGDVVAFDLSSAIDIARRDHGNAPNLHFAQADIMEPPFEARSFDFVVSDQVIHHTPDTVRAFATLAGLVAPGGQFSVYVYRRKGMIRELVDDHVRAVTSAMPVEECMEFSEQVTELGRELSHLNATITLEKGIPLLGIPPGEHDVQRLVYWHVMKCYWNDDWDERLCMQTNFDWYHPPYATRHDEDEVRGWCKAAGLDVVHLDVVESGISVRAERPTG